LAEAGCSLALTGRRTEALEALAREISGKGREVLWVPADVRSAAAVEEVARRCLDKFGAVDILVNNAGVVRNGLLLRLSEEDWDEVLAVNLKAAFLFMRALAAEMIRRHWGRIINISSLAGLIGSPGQANYSASKAGLIGLTLAAAREMSSRGVTVNAVAPGFIETALVAPFREKIEPMVQRIPVGRLGRPEEVAQLVVYLASPMADYITGQVITIDGGLGLS